jgi:hypothetical protein
MCLAGKPAKHPCFIIPRIETQNGLHLTRGVYFAKITPMKDKQANQEKCPECGALWTGGLTCQDHFHQMLYWENEFPGHGEVHHLMVLSYHLQHPSLYSPDGLVYARQLLDDMLERGLSPVDIRRQRSAQVDSGARSWKVTARPGAHGSYEKPPKWTMTAADVIARGAEDYPQSVRDWIKTIHQAIHQSNKLL